MAKYRNCPNCGAPYDLDTFRCPYCSTLYYDMSAIDIDNREPFFMKLRVNGIELTQLVVPVASDIELVSEKVDAFNGNYKIASYTSSVNMTTNISFEAVTAPGRKSLAEINIPADFVQEKESIINKGE